MAKHWRQRWDPDAEFIFLRRLNLGIDPKNPVVHPGDPVPKGDVRLGRGRLKKWFDAGIIGLKDWGPTGKEQPYPHPTPKPDPKPTESLPEGTVTLPDHGATLEQAGQDEFIVTLGDNEPVTLGTLADAMLFIQKGIRIVGPAGGGWYEVYIPGEEQPRKVQGRTALDAFLAEQGG